MTLLMVILISIGLVFSTVMLMREQKLKRQLLEEKIYQRRNKE